MKEVSGEGADSFNARNGGDSDGGTGTATTTFETSRSEVTSEVGGGETPGVTEMVSPDYGQAISTAIVRRIASKAGVEPTALPPLYEWIDPDALDALFASTPTGRNRRGRIEFPYLDYEISVDCEDETTITVAEPNTE